MKFSLPGAIAVTLSLIVIFAVGQFTLLQQAKSQTPAPIEPAPLPIIQSAAEAGPADRS